MWEAPYILKNDFPDETSKDFMQNLQFPEVFTFFKFQLLKMFNFSHLLGFFQLFVNESTVNRENTANNIKV